MKACLRRGKTDAADAGAICEAVTRERIPAVPVKSEAQQADLSEPFPPDLRQLRRLSAARPGWRGLQSGAMASVKDRNEPDGRVEATQLTQIRRKGL
jgi:transposase